MSGLNSVMDTSLSALFAAQAGMATTGHNIANANTAGFSRQMVLTASRTPDVLTYGAIGRGVDVLGVRPDPGRFPAGEPAQPDRPPFLVLAGRLGPV